MRFLLLTILTLTLTSPKAQFSNKESLNFLTTFVKNYNKQETPLLYTKGLKPYTQNEIINALQRSLKLFSFQIMDHKVQITDSLVLTKEEQLYIISEIQKQSDTTLWNQFEISNIKSIPQDTVTAIFKDRLNGWNIFSKKYGNNLHTFGIPIFFRDNQYCAFYYEKLCGYLCGETQFAIYRKEHGTWSLWISIYESVS